MYDHCNNGILFKYPRMRRQCSPFRDSRSSPRVALADCASGVTERRQHLHRPRPKLSCLGQAGQPSLAFLLSIASEIKNNLQSHVSGCGIRPPCLLFNDFICEMLTAIQGGVDASYLRARGVLEANPHDDATRRGGFWSRAVNGGKPVAPIKYLE